MKNEKQNLEIKYDEPFEVTKEQYVNLMTKCSGLVAGRQEKEKYYIKVWMMKDLDFIKNIGQL